MGTIFLSASIPLVDHSQFSETANPFLIQCAVRELVIAVIRDNKIIWGGHPAITPMIWSICEDLGVRYADAVHLYQSRYFEDVFPKENENFQNVTLVKAVDESKSASLRAMRETMLSSENITAAVFIGGMDGIFEEYEILTHHHPKAKVLAIASPGGAARELAMRLSAPNMNDFSDVDFAQMFHQNF